MSKKNLKPPYPAKKILKFLLNFNHPNAMMGDFNEEYSEISKSKGRIKADLWYFMQIPAAVPSFINNSIYWSLIMFRNYLTIAFRNLKKHKSFSVINIAGLAAGMACCILMLLWVADELSYDNFHKNSDNIYRIFRHYPESPDDKTVMNPIPLGPAVKSRIPEIVKAARLSRSGRLLLSNEKVKFYEAGGMFADPDFFNIFSFSFIKGDPEKALFSPHSIVITEALAEKYFGREDPFGKTITVNNRTGYTVTGIIKNIPNNSHLKFDYVRPFSLFSEFGIPLDFWDDVSYYTYLQLREDSDPLRTADKITTLEKEHRPENFGTCSLQPLNRIHLYSNFSYDVEGHGNIKYVVILSAAAFIVLIMACINFMNLATAHAGKRAREIGMRKVSGAKRSDLIKQFFGESLLISFIAMFCGVILIKILLPSFNEIAGKQLTFDFFTDMKLQAVLICVVIITGLVSGSYPALFLSSLQPVKILKSSSGLITSGSFFRKVLIIVQFTFSIMAIIATATVFKQLNYIKNRDLGYKKEQIVYMRLRGGLRGNIETVKNELLASPGIRGVALTDNLPDRLGSGTSDVAAWEGKTPGHRIQFQIRRVDYDYLETFGMEMAEGRFFSKDFATDTSAFILNEAAVKSMGIKSPVGKRFSWYKEGKIIGVIKDFNFVSLHSRVAPMFIILRPERVSYMCIKIGPENISETIAFLGKKWKKFVPEYPFEYKFLDETIGIMYRAEQNLGRIFTYCSFITIFIACLGLFGLALFMAEQRTKEIGIRKVLGASVAGIIFLLLKDFTRWVVLANIIAWPTAWYFMNLWLQDFAFRTDTGILVFVSAGVLVLITALLTVCFQALKAAGLNPVKALKNE